MRFCTVINCMDGRVQLPVIRYLQDRFNVEYVDTITETGPNLILSEQEESVKIQSILVRLKISLEKHKSVGVAIVGHHNCIANPGSKAVQISQLQKAIDFTSQHINGVEIIGLWIDEEFSVHEVI